MEGNELDAIPFEAKVTESPKTAQSFQTDPETGFIVVSGTLLMGPGYLKPGRWGISPEVTFTPAKKLEFLQKLSECWPNISKACEEVGISKITYRNHLLADPKMGMIVDLIAERKTDQVETFQSDLAATNKFAFMDRAMTLRANRPEKFDKARTVVLESKTARIDESTARSRMVKLKNVVDAELVTEGLKEQDEKRKAR